MGTTTSKQDESEKKIENNDESSDVNTPTDKEQNEYKGGANQDEKEPVVEEEIVPIDGIQVRSFLSAPAVSES